MAVHAILALTVPVTAAFGDEVAALSATNLEMASSDTTLSVASLLFDDAVMEAVVEAMCTLGIFVAVWALGSFFGFQRPAQNTQGKGRSKGTFTAKSIPVSASAQQEPAFPKADTSTDDLSRSSSRSSPDGDRRAVGLRSPLTVETDKLAAAVRADKAPRLPALVDAALARMRARSAVTESQEEQCAQLLLASLRSCAAKRQFAEALAVYDHVVRICGGDPCRLGACGSTWSLLLWSAVETAEAHRGKFFISQLCTVGTPTSYDLVNLVRYAVQRRDVEEFKAHLDNFFARGCTVDLLARNRALAICVSGRFLDMADALVARVGDVGLDVIAYNTLMKGYATTSNVLKCFELYSKMRSANIEPTQMTFGILLDACIDAQEMDHARKVYSDLKKSGLALNVVLYTTFIKGLVNAGQIGEAMEILDEMSASPGNEPDLVTYSTLVKANAERGSVVEAVKLLERMMKQGISPDSVVFNTVLTGCCAKPMEPAAIMHVFRWLVAHGLRPATATLSVLIKAFAQTEAWDAALEELEAAPTRYNVWPEARVYGQLAQACAKVGHGIGALQAYVAFVRAAANRGIAVNKASSSRLLRLCHSCGQGSAATAIHQAVVKAGSCIDAELVKKLEAIVTEPMSAVSPCES